MCFRRELPPQRSWAESLDPLELPIEIGVVTEAHSEGDVQHAFIGVDKQLRGRTHSEFVQVGCHCPPGSPLEEPAKGCLVHVKALREFLEFNLLFEVFIDRKSTRL